MKRPIAVILALLYLVVSTGATVHMHYCMGSLVDMGLWHNKSERCSNCGMDNTKARDCCKDKHQFVKLEKDQQASEHSVQQAPLFATAWLPALQSLVNLYHPTSTEKRAVNHPPPLLHYQIIYLLNCVFRI